MRGMVRSVGFVAAMIQDKAVDSVGVTFSLPEHQSRSSS